MFTWVIKKLGFVHISQLDDMLLLTDTVKVLVTRVREAEARAESAHDASYIGITDLTGTIRPGELPKRVLWPVAKVMRAVMDEHGTKVELRPGTDAALAVVRPKRP